MSTKKLTEADVLAAQAAKYNRAMTRMLDSVNHSHMLLQRADYIIQNTFQARRPIGLKGTAAGESAYSAVVLHDEIHAKDEAPAPTRKLSASVTSTVINEHDDASDLARIESRIIRDLEEAEGAHSKYAAARRQIIAELNCDLSLNGPLPSNRTVAVPSSSNELRPGRDNATQTTKLLSDNGVDELLTTQALDAITAAASSVDQLERRVYALGDRLLHEHTNLTAWCRKVEALGQAMGWELPAFPADLNAVILGAAEADELNQRRRWDQRRERHQMRQCDRDAALADGASRHQDAAAQVAWPSKTVAVQTLPLQDSLAKLSRKQHEQLEELIAVIKHASNGMWGWECKPNPMVAFVTTAELSEMMDYDFKQIEYLLESVRAAPIAKDTARAPATRDRALGSDVPFESEETDAQTEAVRIFEYADQRDCSVQHSAPKRDAGTTADAPRVDECVSPMSIDSGVATFFNVTLAIERPEWHWGGPSEPPSPIEESLPASAVAALTTSASIEAQLRGTTEMEVRARRWLRDEEALVFQSMSSALATTQQIAALQTTVGRAATELAGVRTQLELAEKDKAQLADTLRRLGIADDAEAAGGSQDYRVYRRMVEDLQSREAAMKQELADARTAVLKSVSMDGRTVRSVGVGVAPRTASVAVLATAHATHRHTQANIAPQPASPSSAELPSSPAFDGQIEVLAEAALANSGSDAAAASRPVTPPSEGEETANDTPQRSAPASVASSRTRTQSPPQQGSESRSWHSSPATSTARTPPKASARRAMMHYAASAEVADAESQTEIDGAPITTFAETQTITTEVNRPSYPVDGHTQTDEPDDAIQTSVAAVGTEPPPETNAIAVGTDVTCSFCDSGTMTSAVAHAEVSIGAHPQCRSVGEQVEGARVAPARLPDDGARMILDEACQTVSALTEDVCVGAAVAVQDATTHAGSSVRPLNCFTQTFQPTAEVGISACQATYDFACMFGTAPPKMCDASATALPTTASVLLQCSYQVGQRTRATNTELTDPRDIACQADLGEQHAVFSEGSIRFAPPPAVDPVQLLDELLSTRSVSMLGKKGRTMSMMFQQLKAQMLKPEDDDEVESDEDGGESQVASEPGTPPQQQTEPTDSSLLNVASPLHPGARSPKTISWNLGTAPLPADHKRPEVSSFATSPFVLDLGNSDVEAAAAAAPALQPPAVEHATAESQTEAVETMHRASSPAEDVVAAAVTAGAGCCDVAIQTSEEDLPLPATASRMRRALDIASRDVRSSYTRGTTASSHNNNLFGLTGTRPDSTGGLGLGAEGLGPGEAAELAALLAELHPVALGPPREVVLEADTAAAGLPALQHVDDDTLIANSRRLFEWRRAGPTATVTNAPAPTGTELAFGLHHTTPPSLRRNSPPLTLEPDVVAALPSRRRTQPLMRSAEKALTPDPRLPPLRPEQPLMTDPTLLQGGAWVEQQRTASRYTDDSMLKSRAVVHFNTSAFDSTPSASGAALPQRSSPHLIKAVGALKRGVPAPRRLHPIPTAVNPAAAEFASPTKMYTPTYFSTPE